MGRGEVVTGCGVGRGVSSRARQWGVGDRGRCGGAGTLHGAGTKGSQNAANDNVKVHASVVAIACCLGFGVELSGGVYTLC